MSDARPAKAGTSGQREGTVMRERGDGNNEQRWRGNLGVGLATHQLSPH